MSRLQQIEFIQAVKEQFPNNFSNCSVLEFGSHDFYSEGSTRSFFNNCIYIGIDAGPGFGVDISCIAHEYNAPDNSFDTVVSREMFEHDPYWEKSFANMIRLCKSKGLVFFTCATFGRAKHGTLYCDPHGSTNSVDLGWEYYKNLTEKDFRGIFNFDDLFESYQFTSNRFAYELLFWGVKK